MDVVEAIVRELRRKRAELIALFRSSGQLIVHVNPKSKTEPVVLEVRVKV